MKKKSSPAVKSAKEAPAAREQKQASFMMPVYEWTGARLERKPYGARVVTHVRRHRKIYELAEALLFAVALALVIRAYIIEPYKIPSGSMIPTLEIGDRLFVNKFIYDFVREPQVGDVIVFKVPDVLLQEEPDKEVYIKRVVGTPGDELEIRDGYVYVNGDKVDNGRLPVQGSYVSSLRMKDGSVKHFEKLTVPEGMVYVFGDNSTNSYDSRAWGGVPIGNIKGEAFLRWWPLGRFDLIE